MMITMMTASHVPQIAELEKLCFNDPWSENSIASELDNRLSCWLVALDDDKVIGYVGSQTVLGETDMMNIAIHPDHRKRGIATELIVTAEYTSKGCSGCLPCFMQSINILVVR